MTNEEKAKMVADQCKPCSKDFYSGIKQGILLTLKAEELNLEKAKQWDELGDKISKFYDMPNDSARVKILDKQHARVIYLAQEEMGIEYFETEKECKNK